MQDGYDSSDVLVVSTSESDKSWILDSGCSFHMTPNRDWFESFEQLKGGQFILRNNKCYEIKRIGTVRLKLHDGAERVLQEVRFIPGLKRNLISLGTLDQKGYSYKASGGVLKVSKGCMVVMKGVIESGIYVLQLSTVIGSVSIAKEDADLNSLIWPKRLGHVRDTGLLEFEKQDLLCGDKLVKL